MSWTCFRAAGALRGGSRGQPEKLCIFTSDVEVFLSYCSLGGADVF